MVNNGLMLNNDWYIYICKLTIANNRGYDQQEWVMPVKQQILEYVDICTWNYFWVNYIRAIDTR